MDAQTYRDMSAREQAREQNSRRLHWQTTVVLGYNNIPLKMTEDGFDVSPILGHSSLCGTNLDRLILGGVKVMVWSPGIPFWKPSGEGLGGRAKVRFLQQQFQAMHQLPKLTDGHLQIARSAADIRRINAAGGIAVLLHLSGVSHLNDMGILREYYDLGVRMIHCGFQDWPENGPHADTVQYDRAVERIYHGTKLNQHGIRTLEEMKKLGIIVDVAHLLTEGFDDVVSRLEGLPFVYSHGGCAALYANPRTFDDARIRKVAEHRGVYGIGVCFGPQQHATIVASGREDVDVSGLIAEGRKRREQELATRATDLRGYLRQRYSKWNEWEVRELARLNAYVVKPSFLNIVAHMKYLKEHFGPEIVGYGPDYEHTFLYARGLEEVDKTPNLTRALLEEGFTPSEAQGAMGHNFMRVFDAILK